MAQTKANKTSGKNKSPSALLYPEILFCFRLSAEWSCDSPTPGRRAVAPHLRTGLVGKGGEGGKKVPLGNYSLQANLCLNDQPAAQTPKHVHLKFCAANQCKYYLFLLLGEIMATSREGWEWRHRSQPKQAGVDMQLRGGMSLKPSAISKKYILGNT